ncbi:hypothetical protein M885DRAFT_218983 [Pelagophyceae sp. CCMP2097]|nr:hypothetical protein M885DRAFT_218983 [Pelagophyceae sp. CCMP2097]
MEERRTLEWDLLVYELRNLPHRRCLRSAQQDRGLVRVLAEEGQNDGVHLAPHVAVAADERLLIFESLREGALRPLQLLLHGVVPPQLIVEHVKDLARVILDDARLVPDEQRRKSLANKARVNTLADRLERLTVELDPRDALVLEVLDKRVEDGHELARDHVQVHVERDVGPYFVQRRRLGHDQLAGKALVVLVSRLVVALRRRARRRLEVGGGGLLEARGHLPAGPGLGGDHERLRVLFVVGKREQSVEALGPLAVAGVVVAGHALEAVRHRAAQHEANHLLVVTRSPADLVAHAVDHDARGLEFYKRVDDVADRALQRLAGLGTLHSHDELLHIRVVDEVALVQRPHKAEDHALQLRHVRAVEVDEDLSEQSFIRARVPRPLRQRARHPRTARGRTPQPGAWISPGRRLSRTLARTK